MTSGFLVPQEKHFYMHVFLVQLMSLPRRRNLCAISVLGILSTKTLPSLSWGPCAQQNTRIILLTAHPWFEHGARPPSREQRAESKAGCSCRRGVYVLAVQSDMKCFLMTVARNATKKERVLWERPAVSSGCLGRERLS